MFSTICGSPYNRSEYWFYFLFQVSDYWLRELFPRISRYSRTSSWKVIPDCQELGSNAGCWKKKRLWDQWRSLERKKSAENSLETDWYEVSFKSRTEVISPRIAIALGDFRRGKSLRAQSASALSLSISQVPHCTLLLHRLLTHILSPIYLIKWTLLCAMHFKTCIRLFRLVGKASFER